MTNARSQSSLWCAVLLCCFVALAVVVAPWGPSPASGGNKPAAAKAASRFLLSGIEWGTPGEKAVAQLESNGYRRDAKGSDAKRVFCTGTLFDRAVTATGDLDDSGGVVRWTVLVVPVADRVRYPAMRKVYDQVVAELTERHGRPNRFFDKFSFPFERGDDREDQALAEGRATIRTEWKSRSGERMSVAMDRQTAVVLEFRSPQWARVEKDRLKKKAAGL